MTRQSLKRAWLPALVVAAKENARDSFGQIIAIDRGILNPPLGSVLDPGTEFLALAIEMLDHIAANRTWQASDVTGDPLRFDRGQRHQLVTASSATVMAGRAVFTSPGGGRLLEPVRRLRV